MTSVKEKQIGEENKQKAITTEKATAMLLQNLDENTHTELQNTENDSKNIWPKSF